MDIQERVITIMKNYTEKITKIVSVEISQKKYNEVIQNISRNTILHMLCNRLCFRNKHKINE